MIFREFFSACYPFGNLQYTITYYSEMHMCTDRKIKEMELCLREYPSREISENLGISSPRASNGLQVSYKKYQSL